MNYLEIKNERICSFYKNNPEINFETVNLQIIDLFEKMNLDKKLCVNHSNQSNAGQSSNNDLTSIKKLFEEFQTRINDKMSNKINEIMPLLNNNTDEIISKTNIIMKSTDSQIMKDFVNNFEMKSSIMYQNIQQPLYTFIMALEERINTNINSIKENIINHEKQNAKNKNLLNKTPQELIVFILNKIYKTSEIIPFYKKCGISESANQNDFSIYSLKRINKQSILINNVDLDRNITTEEIESFYKIVDENKSNALLSKWKYFSICS
jgi:hypothetical protein